MPVGVDRRRPLLAALALALLVGGLACGRHAHGQPQAAAAERIDSLVADLNADQAARRDEAEQQLIELGLEAGADGVETFLERLPEPSDRMPAEVRTRLGRIAGEVRSRLAERAVTETRVSLDVTDAPLKEVLIEIEKQTGNRLSDHRQQFGQETAAKTVTVAIEDQPFWAALDGVLDAADMSPYPFSGEQSLALVNRPPGTLRRTGRADYSGPFRIEPISVVAERGLRSPSQSGLRVELEIAWEPRLQPIAFTQAAADLEVVGDDGRRIPPKTDGAVFDVEIQPGSHAAEVALPLQLPARTAAALKTLRGKMTALVPSRTVELEFKDLADGQPKSHEAGGVSVTIDRVVKNHALWEVHMRIAVESLQSGLESHRGWVFQNVAFLRGPEGKTIDNAGFETTMQTEHEAGFAYFYELPEGVEIGDCTWVYRTPAAIVKMPIEYELNDVPLP